MSTRVRKPDELSPPAAALVFRIMGATRVTLPNGTVLAAARSPVGFALLLRVALAGEGGVDRGAMTALLYHDDVPTTRSKLRVLLTSLRKAGVAFGEAPAPLTFAPASVVWDASGDGVLFDSFVPTFSDTYARWFEDERAGFLVRLTAPRLVALDDARQRAAWPDVTSRAQEVLAIDPMNEAGHLAMAEALIFTASKNEALSYLAKFEADLGDRVHLLAAPLAALRRRVQHTTPRAGRGTPEAPLFEREQLLERIGTVAQRVRAEGRALGVVLTGPAGIGKTTVLDAGLDQLRLFDWTVVRSRAIEPEQTIALSVVYRLVPVLLEATGAAGAAPTHYQHLQHVLQGTAALTGDIRVHRLHLAAAIADVLRAAATEKPVTLALDDTHWLDTESAVLLEEVFYAVRDCPVCWVFGQRPGGRTWPVDFHLLVVEPLSPTSADALFAHWTPATADLPRAPWTHGAIAAAAGHPMWLRAVAMRADRGTTPAFGLREVSAADALADEATRLAPELLQFLQHLALLGSLATTSRMSALYSDRPGELLRALGSAEGLGLVQVRDHGALSLHDLWSTAVLRELRPLQRQLLHTRILDVLLADADEDAENDILAGVLAHAGDAGTLGRAARAATVLCERWLLTGITAATAERLLAVVAAREIARVDVVPLIERFVVLLQASYLEGYSLQHSAAISRSLARSGQSSPLWELILRIASWSSTGTSAMLTMAPGLWVDVERALRDVHRPENARLSLMHVALIVRANINAGPDLSPIDAWRELLQSWRTQHGTMRALEDHLMLETAAGDSATILSTVTNLDAYRSIHVDRISMMDRGRLSSFMAAALRQAGDFPGSFQRLTESLELTLPAGAWRAAARSLDFIVSVLCDAGRFVDAHAVLLELEALYAACASEAEKGTVTGWNGGEVGMCVQLGRRDLADAKQRFARVVPTPERVGRLMLNGRTTSIGYASVIAYLTGGDLDPWRALFEATATDLNEALRDRGFLARDAHMWRFAAGGIAIGCRDLAVESLHAFTAGRSDRRFVFPVEDFLARLPAMPTDEALAYCYWDRPAVPLASVTGYDALPDIVRHPLKYLVRVDDTSADPRGR
jgi:hypothetical protein